MDLLYGVFFFFKQKTAYEMRISDVSSDVCSSDLSIFACVLVRHADGRSQGRTRQAEFVYRRARVSVEGPASHVFIRGRRSEEHTSELQSLMRLSYAVFCLKKKTGHLCYYKHTAIVTLHIIMNTT